MCNYALGAPQIIPAQIELLSSMWKQIGKNPGTVQKKLRANLITALRGMIEIFREQGDLQSERYFSDLLLEFLMQAEN